MKISKLFLLVLLSLANLLTGNSQDHHVRFAFIGNSITAGANLSNPAEDSYPGQLAEMLTDIYGDTCKISNYAISSRTMLKKGDYPFWEDDSFAYCLQSAPDILFISLGTNDSKPYNWVYGEEFFDDYKSMIDSFKLRCPRTQFFVCLPPPAFEVVWDINETVIVNEIIPLIDSVAQETGAYIVDFHTPLVDSVELFPDYIHPNEQGSRAMAEIVLDRIIETDVVHSVETGYTLVTRLKSMTEHVIESDSAILSWTSINADSVLLNGTSVSLNGSRKVSATVPTVYTVTAYGEMNNDSISILQDFYHPVIGRLNTIPTRAKITVEDTAEVTLSYRDQYGRTMLNDSTEIEWSTALGIGTIVNQSYTGLSYISGTVTGVDTVYARVRDIGDFTVIEITPVNALVNKPVQHLKVFPNPASNRINISNTDFNKLELMDITGRIVYSAVNKVDYINTEKFEEGIYFLKIYINKKTVTEKIIISRD
jgi:acyl-CoA thioesterase I